MKLLYMRYFGPGEIEVESLEDAAAQAFWMIEHNSAAPDKVIGDNNEILADGDKLDELMEEYYQKTFGS